MSSLPRRTFIKATAAAAGATLLAGADAHAAPQLAAYRRLKPGAVQPAGWLATQAADGYFGPSVHRGSLNGHADLWPHMPMLHALRSWAEYWDDPRIESALTRFFQFAARQPDAVFADGWGATRWGDTIDVLFWLHDRTGDQSLLDLTHRIHQRSANWVGTYKPGVDVYRCCPHNYGQGWPYYVEEMWLTTADDGVVAALYGPCTVKIGSTTITEQTSYPFSDTITFRITVAAPTLFPFSVRIPAWCVNPQLTVNGAAVTAPGGPKFTTVTRTWRSGDTVQLRLPMAPRTRVWQNKAVSVDYGALTFALRIEERWNRYAGTANWLEYEVKPGSPWNYGLRPNQQFSVSAGGNVNDPFTLANAPVRLTASAQAIPDWTADSENVVGTMQAGPVSSAAPVQEVTLVPMGAARPRITSFPQTGGTRTWGTPGVLCRIQNNNSAKVLAVEGMSAANSARVVQFADNGATGHLWRIVDVGNGRVKVRNEHSGKVLGIDGMSTANSAQVVQFDDNGTLDHLWQLIDNGDGWFRLRNINSAKVLGVDLMSAADSARVVQYDDNGTADHLWRIIPDGNVLIQNLNSTKVLAVGQMSTADSARIVQFTDNGTADHLWQFLPDANGYFRIRNLHSGKVLGVDRMSTANSAWVVQFADNGTADHLWRLRPDSDNLWRVQNLNSGKLLGVDGMSYADSAQVVQFDDNGTADHVWRLL